MTAMAFWMKAAPAAKAKPDCSFSIGACTVGVRNCLMDSFGDCVNAQTQMPVIEPGELPEACNNGQDDDCDGQVDETPCE